MDNPSRRGPRPLGLGARINVEVAPAHRAVLDRYAAEHGVSLGAAVRAACDALARDMAHEEMARREAAQNPLLR